MNFKYENVGTNENGIQELFEAIGKCQYEFPALPKNATVILTKVGHKAKYVSLDQIIEGMKPQLKEYGVSFVQMVNSTDRDSVITLSVAGHGAVISTSFTFARDRNPQDAGKQITYYKRYQLTSFFGIVGDEDADATSVEDNKRKYEDKIAEEKAEKIEASKPVVIEAERNNPSDDAGTDESREEAQHDSAVRDEGNGKLSLCDRTLNVTDVNKVLNGIKNGLKWSMRDLHTHCEKEGLYPPGVTSLANLSKDAKCDLIDSLKNSPKLTC